MQVSGLTRNCSLHRGEGERQERDRPLTSGTRAPRRRRGQEAGGAMGKAAVSNPAWFQSGSNAGQRTGTNRDAASYLLHGLAARYIVLRVPASIQTGIRNQ